MANYNTYLVMDCKNRTPVLVTSSARKASAELCKGRRVDVWNENEKKYVIYFKNADRMRPLIRVEKDYIRRKQDAATQRNSKNKERNYKNN